jgi:hypothetical protein
MMKKNKKDESMKELNQILHVMIFIVVVTIVVDVGLQQLGYL